MRADLSQHLVLTPGSCTCPFLSRPFCTRSAVRQPFLERYVREVSQQSVFQGLVAGLTLFLSLNLWTVSVCIQVETIASQRPYLGTPVANKLLESAANLLHVELRRLVLLATRSIMPMRAMIMRMTIMVMVMRVSCGEVVRGDLRRYC